MIAKSKLKNIFLYPYRMDIKKIESILKDDNIYIKNEL